MDGIITIVIVAAAIIFKVVGKKLGSAGSDEVFPPLPVDPDMRNFPDHVGGLQDAEDLVDEELADEVVIEEVERALPVKPAKPVTPAKTVEVKDQTPILEEEQPKQKEKIDKKKLIVYSEIMKPKYME
jgi:hypothetical protein